MRTLPDSTLQNNLTIVPNTQLPTVPVHKYQVAADYAFSNGIDLRLTRYYVGVNNAKNSPPYSYSNFQLNAPTGKHGNINFAIDNLFNQDADIRGQFGLGVPLPLNRFATDFSPLLGQNSTELYGLPYRTATLTYTLKLR